MDHLLLLPKNRPGKRGRDFFDFSWSSNWANFLIQEAGRFDLLSAENFPESLPGSVRFVYLPCGLEGSFNAARGKVMRAWIEAGGIAVAEAPALAGLESFKIRLKSGRSPRTFVSDITAPGISVELDRAIRGIKFRTFGWDLAGGEPWTPLFFMNGEPACFKLPVGKGALFLLTFNLGLLLQGLQQGIPAGGQRRLRKVFGTQQRVVEPEDLVSDQDHLNAPLPFADLFERFLFRVITSQRPYVRAWYLPFRYDGALINTHDEEGLGGDPRIFRMNEEENRREIRAALFVMSGKEISGRWPDPAVLRRWNDGEGPEIALHWDRFKKPVLKIRSRKFLMREESLAKQIRELEKILEGKVRFNRNHYLALGEYYGEHFDKLSDAGISMDSTYGPNQGGRGYLFGTGYPFLGISWGGKATNVFELPFVAQEMWGGADPDFLKRLLLESKEQFHQCIVILFHPHYQITEKAGRDMWLGAVDEAIREGHWMPSFGEFFRFFEARQALSLTSADQAGCFEVEMDALAEGLAAAIPYELGDGSRFSGAVCGEKTSDFREVSNAWTREILLPVPVGKSKWRIIYESR